MEAKIVKFFNRLGNGRLDPVTDFLSRVKYLLYFWIVVSAFSIFLSGEKREELVLAFAVVTFLHFAITEGVIKHLLTKLWGVRRRPYLLDGEIRPIGRQFSDSSFPSSHIASTIAMLFPITYIFPFIWPVSLVFVLLMAFSRLHNGMHYPSDILAGIALGSGYGALAIHFSQLIY